MHWGKRVFYVPIVFWAHVISLHAQEPVKTIIKINLLSDSEQVFNMHFADSGVTVIFESRHNYGDFGKPTHFNASVDFRNALFPGTVPLSNARFYQQSDFSYCQFKGKTDFFYTQFRDSVNFSNALFYDEGSFQCSRFKEMVNFSHCTFSNNTSFIDARFQKNVRFQGAGFRGDLTFLHANFGNSANFKSAIFVNGCDFSGAVFETDADFSNAVFSNTVNFTNAAFNQYLCLSNIKVRPNVNFIFFSAALSDIVDLSNNTVLFNEFNLNDCKFDNNRARNDSSQRLHYLNLYKSDISKIRMDYEHFRLCFFDPLRPDISINIPKAGENILYSTFLRDKSRRDYLRAVFPFTRLSDPVIISFLKYCQQKKIFPRRLPEDEITSIYERVLKNLQQQGEKRSYEALDIQYQNHQHGWFILPYIWNSYGYHKEWFFYWTAGLLFLFTIITFIFLPILNKEVPSGGVYYIEKLPGNIPLHSYGNIMRRLRYSFIYTAMIFFLLGLKLENINFRKNAVVYILLVYTTGIVCVAYMAGFVLQK